MLFTPEHRQLQDTVSQFIEKEINPYAQAWDEKGEFPIRDLFLKLGDLGLLGISKPQSCGGLGLDYTYQLAFAEALGGAHCGGVPLAIGVQTDMATPALARFASEALQQAFLLPAIRGEMISAIAVSEPNAGSDVSAITTKASAQGEEYVLNGSKMWITNASDADFFCVLANTSDEAPHKNKSLFIVPRHLEGVSVGEKLDKMGMRCSSTAPVYFDNVRLPASYLIGEPGAGFRYQMQQFQEERMFGAALCIRGLEYCIHSTLEYTAERKAFGAPLLANQSIHFSLAEMQTEVECLRALVYRAAEAYVQGEDVTQLASMAKLKAGRLTRTIPDACLQYWGGMGYMQDSTINRLYRDYRLTAIGGGADEVMLGIICKTMGMLRRANAGGK